MGIVKTTLHMKLHLCLFLINSDYDTPGMEFPVSFIFDLYVFHVIISHVACRAQKDCLMQLKLKSKCILVSLQNVDLQNFLLILTKL